MTEERITEVETPSGNTHTRTTIVTDERPAGGSSKWVMLVILAVLAVGAFVLFSQMSDAEVAKDNAVADMAGSVGDAADNVGEAAGNIGDAAKDAADNITE